jgi:hypothetical protein
MNRVFGTVSAIALLWQLVKPFEQWEAFRLGIIDAHGKLLGSPQTAEERNAYDLLTRVALNLKCLKRFYLAVATDWPLIAPPCTGFHHLSSLSTPSGSSAI